MDQAIVKECLFLQWEQRIKHGRNFGWFKGIQCIIMVSDGLVWFISIIYFRLVLANPKGKWIAAASCPSKVWGSSIGPEGDNMLFGALFSSITTDKKSVQIVHYEKYFR